MERGNKLQKKLQVHLGGYHNRSKTLRHKILEASDRLKQATFALNAHKTLQISEEAAIQRRLEGLRDEVGFVSKREREAQDVYRSRNDELNGLKASETNGYH